MFTQRKAHSKGFWEHSFTSEGKERERDCHDRFSPPRDVCVSAV